MENRAKYLAILLLTVLISAITSYATTLSLNPIDTQNLQEMQELSSQDALKTKVNLLVEYLEFDPPFGGKVKVKTDLALENLTVVYRYTCINGTVITNSIDYGRCVPSLGFGFVLEAGGTLPDVYFKIPEYIVSASSSRIKDELGFLHFDIQPQIEVLEVYGYT